MPANESDAPPPLPSNALPDVAPPTAGFILQLFLIPLIIVMIIVTVWLMFSWLAHMGNDPQSLVEGVKRGDDKAWQNLGALADLLRNPQYDELKRDKVLADSLAKSLQEQIEDGKVDENALRVRIFICRALGEFHIVDGLPALLDAATAERDLAEIGVRRAAIEGIAVLAGNVGPDKIRNEPGLLPTLEKIAFEKSSAAEDKIPRSELRSAAAFALGVIGGEDALDTLEAMRGDAYANTRYNAATGLARHGDARCLPVLLEMLDPANKQGIENEPFESGREYKQAMILANGARASKLLIEHNDSAELSDLKAALRTLEQASVSRQVKYAAKEALEALESRPAQAEASVPDAG